MIELLSDPAAWLALATLTALEIVLGVDNIIFLSVIAARLPEHQRARARRLGLLLAMGLRILLLLTITWIMGMTRPLFTLFDDPVTVRDLILILGGLFLIAKSTMEVHAQLEGPEIDETTAVVATFGGVLVQIGLIDLVFSIDSVVTAIGLVKQVEIMIAAVVISIGVMMVAAGPVGAFVDKHPTIKMLALSFLLLIGMALIADGLGLHIPKGYIYFAMAFSFGVEMLNLRVRRRRLSSPIRLKRHQATETVADAEKTAGQPDDTSGR
ncbi:MAG: TerC family protein [Gammaproteobacteria bacterium]